jgi:Sulfotransferase family
MTWLVQRQQKWTMLLYDMDEAAAAAASSTMEKTMPIAALPFADNTLVHKADNRNLQAKAAAVAAAAPTTLWHNETIAVASSTQRRAMYVEPSPTEDSLIPIPPIVLPHRVFLPWNTSFPWPCFHPTHGDDSLHWTNKRKVLRTRTTTGLFFVKLLKTASSTCASVHVRLARNVATREQQQLTKTNQSLHAWDVCQTRHLHGHAGPRGLDYRRREKTQSFLWSVVRQPVPRYLSEFLHFAVARRGVDATPENLLQYLQRNDGRHANQHQVAWLSLSLRKRDEITYTRYAQLLASRDDTETLHTLADRTQRILNEIMNGYNFIGVAERLDETLVVLSLLLHRPLADVLHVNVKRAGGYDDGAFEGRCVRIPTVPANLVDNDTVQAFLATDPAWHAYIQAEHVLYQAVNASLDATIDFLGRDLVQGKVAQLRHAQQVVETTCRHVVLPCTTDGVRIPDDQTDCLQGDLACGLDCLDDVATRLALW